MKQITAEIVAATINAEHTFLNTTPEIFARSVASTIAELKERSWSQIDAPKEIVLACYAFRRGLITEEECELAMNKAEELYLAK
jgi:hypothetical protein